jgi:hypothetical protein
VSLARPEAECATVTFAAALAMDEASEVALEDYARVLTRARAAEAVPADEPGIIQGVHLCGVAAPAPAVMADIEGFARSLTAVRAGSLGWS